MKSNLRANSILTNHIHLWQIPLNLDSYKQYDAILPPDEKERAYRFIFEKHRRRFILAHYALRKILSEYLGISPERIIFKELSHGKPTLIEEQNPLHLEFNLSHSGETALLGIRLEKIIGVDIEYHSTRDYLDLAEHVFSIKECQELMAIKDAEAQINSFFHIWAQKEAFIKAIGQGLSYPLKDFSVSPVFPAALTEAVHEDISQWYFHSFKPFSDAHAAIATLKPIERVETFAFLFQ